MIRMLKVESLSVPNKFYIVRLINNKFLCNCAYFLMRGRIKKTCKHIEKAKENTEAKKSIINTAHRSRGKFGSADSKNNYNKLLSDFKF